LHFSLSRLFYAFVFRHISLSVGGEWAEWWIIEEILRFLAIVVTPSDGGIEVGFVNELWKVWQI
jgi:hypothetical protein